MKKNIFKLSADTNTIVSFSAIIVSIASIFITTWQGMEIRKHNRLSVRPKLDAYFSVDVRDFEYIIINSGLGPANIIERKTFIDGKEFLPERPNVTWSEALRDTLNLIDLEVSTQAVSPGVTLQSGERRAIIHFESKNGSLSIDPMDIYKKLSFEITYESMYGESFTCRIPN